MTESIAPLTEKSMAKPWCTHKLLIYISDLKMMFLEGIIFSFMLSIFCKQLLKLVIKVNSILLFSHQRSPIHSSFIMVVYNPVPFNTTLNRKWCGKNKSNYSAVWHQKLCLQRGLQTNMVEKQTEDSRCAFGDMTERHTNSNFLF